MRPLLSMDIVREIELSIDPDDSESSTYIPTSVHFNHKICVNLLYMYMYYNLRGILEHNGYNGA